MSEEDGGARREGLGLEGLLELVDSHAFCFGVDTGSLPCSDAVLGHLLRVLLAGQRQHHGHSGELLEGTCPHGNKGAKVQSTTMEINKLIGDDD